MLCEVPQHVAFRPAVIDFGISKLAADGSSTEELVQLTRTGVTIGTPVYMGPEQLGPGYQPDRRSDVYALGVILFELLTGTVPFDTDSYAALVAHKLSDPPVPIREVRPDVDPALEKVLLRALAQEPDERIPTVGELARELEPFAEAAASIRPSRSGGRRPSTASPTPSTCTAGRSRRGGSGGGSAAWRSWSWSASASPRWR